MPLTRRFTWRSGRSASRWIPAGISGHAIPGDPGVTAVYDFLPDALLAQVVNREDFRGILVFDKWAGNVDGRQCVFYRAMVRAASAPGRPGFVARMIDHGFTFNGPHWDFPDSPLQGLYARRLVYEGVKSLDDFQPWLDQAIHFPEEAWTKPGNASHPHGSKARRTLCRSCWSAFSNGESACRT